MPTLAQHIGYRGLVSVAVAGLAHKAEVTVSGLEGVIVDDYITGHLEVSRQPDGAKAVAARLRTATASLAKTPAASVTRHIVNGS